jgi:hypothetical protein
MQKQRAPSWTLVRPMLHRVFGALSNEFGDQSRFADSVALNDMHEVLRDANARQFQT